MNRFPLDEYKEPEDMPIWTREWLTEAQVKGMASQTRWLELLGKTNLKSRAKSVGPWIAHHCLGDHKHAWPSIPTLADETGYSERTVSRAIHVLQAAGFLAVEEPEWPDDRRSMILYLCWPESAPARASRSEAGERRLAAKRERQRRYREKQKAERDRHGDRHDGEMRRDGNAVQRDGDPVQRDGNPVVDVTVTGAPERTRGNGLENGLEELVALSPSESCDAPHTPTLEIEEYADRSPSERKSAQTAIRNAWSTVRGHVDRLPDQRQDDFWHWFKPLFPHVKHESDLTWGVVNRSEAFLRLPLSEVVQ